MNYAEAEKMLAKCGQSHVLAYWKKLGAANRSEAVAIAMRRQLLKT